MDLQPDRRPVPARRPARPDRPHARRLPGPHRGPVRWRHLAHCAGQCLLQQSRPCRRRRRRPVRVRRDLHHDLLRDRANREHDDDRLPLPGRHRHRLLHERIVPRRYSQQHRLRNPHLLRRLVLHLVLDGDLGHPVLPRRPGHRHPARHLLGQRRKRDLAGGVGHRLRRARPGHLRGRAHPRRGQRHRQDQHRLHPRLRRRRRRRAPHQDHGHEPAGLGHGHHLGPGP